MSGLEYINESEIRPLLKITTYDKARIILNNLRTMFRGRLLYALKISGHNESELALASGVSTATISSYVRGKRLPRLEVLIKMANFLRTTPNYLLGFDIHTNEIHSNIPKIINFLREKHYMLTMTEKEEIIAALVGHSLYKNPNLRT